MLMRAASKTAASNLILQLKKTFTTDDKLTEMSH